MVRLLVRITSKSLIQANNDSSKNTSKTFSKMLVKPTLETNLEL